MYIVRIQRTLMQDLYCTYTVKMKQLMAANTFLLYFLLNKILLHIYDKASYAMLSTFVKIKVLLEMKHHTTDQ